MIPPSFKPAVEHGVLPVDHATQTMGLSFKLDDGSYVRLRVPVWSMLSMAGAIYAYLPRQPASRTLCPSCGGRMQLDVTLAGDAARVLVCVPCGMGAARTTEARDAA
jgi:hypothetical protein